MLTLKNGYCASIVYGSSKNEYFDTSEDNSNYDLVN